MRVLVLLALVACLPPPKPAAVRDISDQRLAHVEVISECYGLAEGVTRYGSGVIIDQTRVLTAAHVVRCSTIPRVSVILWDGSRVRMQLEKDLAMFGDGTDLATLEQFSAFDIPPAIISNTWWTYDPNLNSKPGQSGTGVYEDGKLVGVISTTYGIAPIWPHREKLGL